MLMFFSRRACCVPSAVVVLRQAATRTHAIRSATTAFAPTSALLASSGVVKYYDIARRFGYITDTATNEVVFARERSLVFAEPKSRPRGLSARQAVEFDLAPDTTAAATADSGGKSNDQNIVRRFRSCVRVASPGGAPLPRLPGAAGGDDAAATRSSVDAARASDDDDSSRRIRHRRRRGGDVDEIVNPVKDLGRKAGPPFVSATALIGQTGVSGVVRASNDTYGFIRLLAPEHRAHEDVYYLIKNVVAADTIKEERASSRVPPATNTEVTFDVVQDPLFAEKALATNVRVVGPHAIRDANVVGRKSLAGTVSVFIKTYGTIQPSEHPALSLFVHVDDVVATDSARPAAAAADGGAAEPALAPGQSVVFDVVESAKRPGTGRCINVRRT